MSTKLGLILLLKRYFGISAYPIQSSTRAMSALNLVDSLIRSLSLAPINESDTLHPVPEPLNDLRMRSPLKISVKH
ncbi:hypothetical protein APHAL10511_002547 [Amanita phalloides]|nr:hypothetical protein APHAL10511_002547 [Amanita phalloides]